MKKILLTWVFVSFQFVLVSKATAQAETSDLPCLEVKKACEAAGFSKGKAKEGRGLVKDCIRKLSEGQSVDGVKLNPAVIKACKDNRDSK